MPPELLPRDGNPPTNNPPQASSIASDAYLARKLGTPIAGKEDACAWKESKSVLEKPSENVFTLHVVMLPKLAVVNRRLSGLTHS